MICLSEADVAAVLPMRDAIGAVESALRAQAADAVIQPLRVVTRSAAGFFGAMPCAIASTGLGAKLVTFFPSNAARGMHTHHAVIALFDPATGMPAALIDGRLITEMRTAATSAVATRFLSHQDAGVAAILGTGVQARAHIQALREIGMLRTARVWGRNAEHARALTAWAVEQGVKAVCFETAAQACLGADIVCTLTAALQPILTSADVADGCHVNAVGASAPTMQELAPGLVARASLFVDTIEGAMNEPGDIVIAIREGALPPAPEMTRLCDVVAGKARGRRSAKDVTLFKSLGMAIEDVSCAVLALERAQARGLGTTLHA